jgi:hypothetical protein
MIRVRLAAAGRDAELLLSSGSLSTRGARRYAINRSAVIVTPAQPFLDWLHRADPTSAELSLEASAWPVDRTFDTFICWFEYSVHSVLVDLCDDPLMRDEI